MCFCPFSPPKHVTLSFSADCPERNAPKRAETAQKTMPRLLSVKALGRFDGLDGFVGRRVSSGTKLQAPLERLKSNFVLILLYVYIYIYLFYHNSLSLIWSRWKSMDTAGWMNGMFCTSRLQRQYRRMSSSGIFRRFFSHFNYPYGSCGSTYRT